MAQAPSLFHILLDRAAEREQRCRSRWAPHNKFDHAPPVLENPRPGELIAEIVDLGLIRRGRALQFLQSDGIRRILSADRRLRINGSSPPSPTTAAR